MEFSKRLAGGRRGDATPEKYEVTKRSLSPYLYYGLALLVILLFALIRFRLRDMPLERDEGEYAYAGQLILQGIPPYQLAYSMKLPGTYAAYAVILWMFGQTPTAVHLGLMLVNAATALLTFFLAKRLLGYLAGVLACASYALLSASPSVLGFAGHATHFVVLPAIAGILLLLRATESGKTWPFFCSGLLLGLSLMMKQPGIFFCLFAGLYLLRNELRPPVDWAGLASRASALATGLIVPCVLTCLLLLRAGVFPRFWFWTASYAGQYGSNLGVGDAFHIFREAFPLVMAPSILIWAIAALGLTVLLWNPDACAHSAFVGWFSLFSFLAVCPGFYFREHYFILMLPAVSLLAGVAVCSATQSLSAAPRTRALSAAPMLLFLVAFGYSIVHQRAFLFESRPLTACREVYGLNPFPEALKIAEYVKAHTSERARIAVVGSEPEIYFYSGRHSATGYIYTYGLMERQKYALRMQKEMAAEIEKARPEALVYVDVPYSWLVRPDSDPFIFKWTIKYAQDHYDLVGPADIRRTTQYHWGEDARASRANSPSSVYVFMRKAS
jgi:hypothetical protein